MRTRFRKKVILKMRGFAPRFSLSIFGNNFFFAKSNTFIHLHYEVLFNSYY